MSGIKVDNLPKTGYPYTGDPIEPMSMEGMKVKIPYLRFLQKHRIFYLYRLSDLLPFRLRTLR